MADYQGKWGDSAKSRSSADGLSGGSPAANLPTSDADDQRKLLARHGAGF
jgi:hypothetical protein